MSRRKKAGADALATVSTDGMLDVERARDLIANSRDVEQLFAITAGAEAVAQYHRVRGASISAVNDAIEIAIRAQRRIGQFLDENVPAQGGRPPETDPEDASSKKLTLKEIGLAKKEARRCRQLAAIGEDELDQHIKAIRAKGERLTTAGTIAATSESKDYDGDEWGTPPEIIALARDVLGEIDLDPASNERAQTVVLAGSYYTKREDGLSCDWKGRVWLNPPYSQPLIAQFTGHLIDQVGAGNVEEAICLVNNGTETEWCQRLLASCNAVCFSGQRIAFLDKDGKPQKGTRQGQLLFYFGDDPDSFEASFSDVGQVLRP